MNQATEVQPMIDDIEYCLKRNICPARCGVMIEATHNLFHCPECNFTRERFLPQTQEHDNE